MQQPQPTETLHCSKLLQNIKLKILRDISLYPWKILRSRVVACFDASAIWNLSLQGQQSRPILRISKWRSLPEKTGIHTVLQLFSLWDQVYFVHPSTDISVNISTDVSTDISTDTRPICRSTYLPTLSRDMSVNISAVIGRLSPGTRPICRSICRPTYRSIYWSIHQSICHTSPNVVNCYNNSSRGKS